METRRLLERSLLRRKGIAKVKRMGGGRKDLISIGCRGNNASPRVSCQRQELIKGKQEGC